VEFHEKKMRENFAKFEKKAIGLRNDRNKVRNRIRTETAKTEINFPSAVYDSLSVVARPTDLCLLAVLRLTFTAKE